MEVLGDTILIIINLRLVMVTTELGGGGGVVMAVFDWLPEITDAAFC